MLEIGEVLVHKSILSEEFVCNLTRCKGACCVQGSSGAPLETEELARLAEIYPKIKHTLTAEGKTAIEKQGTYVKDADGDNTTTCVDGNGACAYAVFDHGIAKCGIEQAYNTHLVSWKKPVSCHLYPIRVTHYQGFDALHYDQWHICTAACDLGKKLKVPVYVFLKEALIRSYGAPWYTKLSAIATKQV